MGDFMNENGLRAATDMKQYFVGKKKIDIFKTYGPYSYATQYVTTNNLGRIPYLIYSDTNVECETITGHIVPIAEAILGNPQIIGIRPILDYSSIELPNDRVRRYEQDLFELEYGFFPQIDSSLRWLLEAELSKDQLIKTSNYYAKSKITYNSFGFNNIDRLDEYLFKCSDDESRYVRVVNDDSSIEYFRVSSLDWFIDEKNKILISKNILFTVNIDKLDSPNNLINFVINYINNYFLKEIAQHETINLNHNTSKSIVAPNKYEVEKVASSTEQVKKFDYENQLAKFMNLEVEPLELNSLSVTVFGSNLSEHGKAISDVALCIIDIMDNDSVYNIKDEIRKLNQSKASNFIFSRSYSASEIIQNNKKVLTNIEDSLNGQQEIMLEQVKRLDYAKKLVALFVTRLNDYISKIKNALVELSSLGTVNIFEESEIKAMKTILENNLLDYEKAVSVHTAQYENMNLLFTNYAISLNKMMTYHNTLLPSLFTAVAISSGILAQQESLASIKEIDTLLDNVIQANNDYLNNNRQIKNLDESIHNMLVNEGMVDKDTETSDKILTKK